MIISVNIKPKQTRKNCWTAYVWTMGDGGIPHRQLIRGDLFSIMKKIQEISDDDTQA